MLDGECTITLQDVVKFKFKLPVDGEPITRSLQYDWEQVCEDFMGIQPLELKGSRLSILWLASQFIELSPNANDITIQLIEGF